MLAIVVFCFITKIDTTRSKKRGRLVILGGRKSKMRDANKTLMLPTILARISCLRLL
jgi:hypothetical protein